MRLHDPALVRGQPHLFRLGDQIPDRNDEPVIPDGDALPCPLGPKSLGRERIVGNGRPQGNDGGQSILEIVAEGARIGLVFRRDFPFFGRLHERLLRPSAERPYPFNMAGIAEPSTGRRSMTHKKP